MQRSRCGCRLPPSGVASSGGGTHRPASGASSTQSRDGSGQQRFRWEYCPLADGQAPLPEFFAYLRQLKYDGIVSPTSFDTALDVLGLKVLRVPSTARMASQLLRRRAEIMVARITGCTEAQAAEALAQCDGSVKTAAVIIQGLDRGAAEALLERSSGNLRTALEALAKGP